jgi:hypothetical protein
MENSVIVIFIGFFLLLVIGYSIMLFRDSNIHKEREKPIPKPTSPPLPPKCDPNDLRQLKKLLKDAILTLRYNIKTIKDNKILQLRPELLLSMYPFYHVVLKVPKYLKANPCYGRDGVSKAMQELFGPEPEKSNFLHVKRHMHTDYYILIDLFDAIEYYDKYYDEGIDDII